MTDYEINLRCAEAFGHERFLNQQQWKLEAPAVACKLGLWAGECIVWNPLHDDAQALALVRKFGLCIYHDLLRPNEPWDIEYEVLREGPEGERYPIKTVATAQGADLLRTICLCVAALQSSKPEG